MHKVPSALLGIQQAVSKNGSHWLFLFWKQQTWWRKALISHSHGLKLHLYYSLARWSWENPPTSPRLTCKMENIGVHICWVSKYYIRLHRFLAHNKPSKAKDYNCYNNTRVERVLVPHHHFITKKIGAQGDEEICPRSWPFPEPPCAHTHKYTDGSHHAHRAKNAQQARHTAKQRGWWKQNPKNKVEF